MYIKWATYSLKLMFKEGLVWSVWYAMFARKSTDFQLFLSFWKLSVIFEPVKQGPLNNKEQVVLNTWCKTRKCHTKYYCSWSSITLNNSTRNSFSELYIQYWWVKVRTKCASTITSTNECWQKSSIIIMNYANLSMRFCWYGFFGLYILPMNWNSKEEHTKI